MHTTNLRKVGLQAAAKVGIAVESGRLAGIVWTTARRM